ncbi:MAG: hypothetical protein PUC12_00375 [Clostridiales bacterium]|nr:hypothetical protein [Clostridiales bacterium]
MIKSDIRDLAFGIVLIFVGIFAIFYFNNDYLKYKNAEEHYKVKATLVSQASTEYYKEDEEGDYEKKTVYYATWQYTVKDVNYTYSTWEDYVPPSSKTIYVYKDEDGEMVTSASKGLLSLLGWNALGLVIIAGGIAYIVQSIQRTRLPNKRRRTTKTEQ